MKYQNNPLNIRYNKLNNWNGMVKPSHGFCQFRDMKYCYRAAVKIFYRYYNHGLRTISQFITRYAPPSDNNNTSAYIDKVCYALDCQPWDNFCFDEDYLYKLLRIMSIIECGEYSVEFDKSIYDAFDMLGITNKKIKL